MKSKVKIKSKYLPVSQYDQACGVASTYSGTMQNAAQKKSKKLSSVYSNGGYSSYRILDQIEQM